jgi:hypothetical protein
MENLVGATPFICVFSLLLVMRADSSYTHFPFGSDVDSVEDKGKWEDFPMEAARAQLRLYSS